MTPPDDMRPLSVDLDPEDQSVVIAAQYGYRWRSLSLTLTEAHALAAMLADLPPAPTPQRALRVVRDS